MAVVRTNDLASLASSTLRDAFLHFVGDKRQGADQYHGFFRAFPGLLANRLGYRVVKPTSSLHRTDALDNQCEDPNMLGFVDRDTKTISLVKGSQLEQRMTLLHELSHIILGHPPSGKLIYRTRPAARIRRETPEENRWEQEADCLAVELALPEKYVQRVFRSIFATSINLASDAPIVLHVSRGMRHKTPYEFAYLLAGTDLLPDGRPFTSLRERFGVPVHLIAKRLVELGLVHNTPVKQPRTLPKIIIFSTVRGLAMADALKTHLDYVGDVTVWSDDVFKPSNFNIPCIVSKLETSDFAICIFAADDPANQRGKKVILPRDNVVFESGLAMGKLDWANVVILVPDDEPTFAIATDFQGFGTVGYYSKRTDNYDSMMRTPAAAIKKLFCLSPG